MFSWKQNRNSFVGLFLLNSARTKWFCSFFFSKFLFGCLHSWVFCGVGVRRLCCCRKIYNSTTTDFQMYIFYSELVHSFARATEWCLVRPNKGFLGYYSKLFIILCKTCNWFPLFSCLSSFADLCSSYFSILCIFTISLTLLPSIDLDV